MRIRTDDISYRSHVHIGEWRQEIIVNKFLGQSRLKKFQGYTCKSFQMATFRFSFSFIASLLTVCAFVNKFHCNVWKICLPGGKWVDFFINSVKVKVKKWKWKWVDFFINSVKVKVGWFLHQFWRMSALAVGAAGTFIVCGQKRTDETIPPSYYYLPFFIQDIQAGKISL